MRLEEALALFRQVENWLGEAQVLKSLGDVALMQARYGDARVAAGRGPRALSSYR